jgi:hypothetical protein
MRRIIRYALEKSLPPKFFAGIMAARSRSHQVKYIRQIGMSELASQFTSRFGLVVRHGPFQGLRYTPEAVRDRLVICKLLGTYEKELHPIVQSIGLDSYDCIVDVGCAEGYYATGLALRTNSTVYAFDVSSAELALASQLARENSVADRVRLLGWCDSDHLARIAGSHKRPFILSDCEGYETELFTENLMPRLKHADLLIELHGRAKHLLLERLRLTHQVHSVSAVPRTRDDVRFTELEIFSPNQRLSAVNEFRGDQCWLWATSMLKSA